MKNFITISALSCPISWLTYTGKTVILQRIKIFIMFMHITFKERWKTKLKYTKFRAGCTCGTACPTIVWCIPTCGKADTCVKTARYKIE